MGVKPGLTVGEEHRSRVFENRLLMRIYGAKRQEWAKGWRKLSNEEDEMRGGVYHAW
jgi:hypothetical protein